MNFVIGCDEAGRGCVIGALAMTAFAVEKRKEQHLRIAGARDSKEMTPKKREEVLEKLKLIGDYKTRLISAVEITAAMEQKVSLNEIEAIALSKLLDDFVTSIEKRGDAVETIYLDSPDPNPEKYEQRIRKNSRKLKSISIVSSNKAENKYPSVAAASVVAKTTRDAELEKIKEVFGEDFGTGYTHDAVTIDFVKRHLKDEKLAPYLRTKWKTIKNLQTVQVDLNKFI
jgi:ribonuclease HII